MPTTSRLSPHAVAFEPAGSIPTKSDNDHHLVGVPKKEVADQNQPPNKNGKDNNKNKNNDELPTNEAMNGGRGKKTRSRTRACRQRRKQLNPNRVRTDDVRKIVSQNVQGWDDDKMEETITIMETHNIDAYLLQGTCMAGNWDKWIKRDCGSYLILHHNHQWLGSENGVAIVLSPAFAKAYERAGSITPITTGSNSEENFYGRFIGIWLSFPNIDSYGKKIKGELKIFLASAHHPNNNDPLEYEEFNDRLAELLLESEPYDENLAEILLEVDSPYKKSCRLIGHTINANVGTRDCEGIKCVLGPHGVDNLDTNGELARKFMLSQNLRVLNTYFQHDDKNKEESYMLNIMTSSMSLFKRVRNCSTFHGGLRGTNKSVTTAADISLTSIKHNGDKKGSGSGATRKGKKVTVGNKKNH